VRADQRAGTRVYGSSATRSGIQLSRCCTTRHSARRNVDAFFCAVSGARPEDFCAPSRRSGSRDSLSRSRTRRGSAASRRLRPLAARIGAVITVVVRGGGRLYGYNTDSSEFCEALSAQCAGGEPRFVARGRRRARAAALALAQLGQSCRFRRAVWSVPCSGARRRSSGRGGGPNYAGNIDAIVNCTPVGMHPHGGSPLESRGN